MLDLTPADYSLLSWVYQAGVSAQSLSIRFHHHTLVVQCQTTQEAVKLWERRSILQMPGTELCFRVKDTFYVGAAI
ncbi:MAG TPA: hypothetical protein V6C65_10755 [Allocoleopsis sp.]